MVQQTSQFFASSRSSALNIRYELMFCLIFVFCQKRTQAKIRTAKTVKPRAIVHALSMSLSWWRMSVLSGYLLEKSLYGPIGDHHFTPTPRMSDRTTIRHYCYLGSSCIEYRHILSLCNGNKMPPYSYESVTTTQRRQGAVYSSRLVSSRVAFDPFRVSLEPYNFRIALTNPTPAPPFCQKSKKGQALCRILHVPASLPVAPSS